MATPASPPSVTERRPKRERLAPAAFVWDMDHTLIANDCDVSWKEFLVKAGYAPASALAEAAAFFAQYQRGELDPERFIAFQLREFKGRTEAEMTPLADDHFDQFVRPRIYPQARERLRVFGGSGRPLAILTATNRVIAQPLASHLGVSDLLATELEKDADGRFTGRIAGEYCGGEGKLAHLRPWCTRHGLAVEELSYYGDSTSDIPVLAVVGFPHAVNPMPGLRVHAQTRGWPILDYTPPPRG